jgi:hypothetical protein
MKVKSFILVFGIFFFFDEEENDSPGLNPQSYLNLLSIWIIGMHHHILLGFKKTPQIMEKLKYAQK